MENHLIFRELHGSQISLLMHQSVNTLIVVTEYPVANSGGLLLPNFGLPLSQVYYQVSPVLGLKAVDLQPRGQWGISPARESHWLVINIGMPELKQAEVT